MTSKNEHPDISNTWEITLISDYEKFMDFILSKAEPEEKWFLNNIVLKSSKESLRSKASFSLVDHKVLRDALSAGNLIAAFNNESITL